jgi:hypothetical protein
MNINFFTWIREGVKQAVLHGVSDAVGHIGSRGEDDEMPQRLLEVIRQSEATTATAAAPRIESSSSSRPKKLGRSLDQIVNSEKSSS